MLPRPPVVIDGLPSEDHPLDVLGSGSERDLRLTPAGRRRLQLASAVLAVGVAAVVGGLEVQERRDAAAQERRVAGMLQLTSDWGVGITVLADPPPAQSVEVELFVQVRNDGPRDVTVTRASAAGMRLLAPVPVPAQTTSGLVLRQRIQCGADTPPLAEAMPGPAVLPGPLRLTARTAGGNRTTTIDRPPYGTDHAALACAFIRDTPPPAG